MRLKNMFISRSLTNATREGTLGRTYQKRTPETHIGNAYPEDISGPRTGFIIPDVLLFCKGSGPVGKVERSLTLKHTITQIRRCIVLLLAAVFCLAAAGAVFGEADAAPKTPAPLAAWAAAEAAETAKITEAAEAAGTPETPGTADGAAWELYALGLFRGTGNDAAGQPVFELDRPLNRHEAVTMLVRLLGKEGEALTGTWTTPFTDVAEWAEPYVGYAYVNGLTRGVSGSAYDGEAPVTATQYLTFILRTLGYEDDTDFQWDRAWELSDRLGISDGSYGTGGDFLRGDAAILSRNALNATLKDGSGTLYAVYHPFGAPKGNEKYGLTAPLEAHFIDVGQADAALVVCEGRAMLIDGGDIGDSSLIYSYLERHGLDYLDYIVCSHPHEDHVGGLAGALNYATVGAAYCSVDAYDSRAFESFRKYLDQQGVTLTVPRPGDSLPLGGADVTFLGPVSQGNSVNNNSLILRISYGDVSFLFTGEPPGILPNAGNDNLAEPVHKAK